MKATANKYKIVTSDKGRTWYVVSQETNQVVKKCKTFKNARNWHHALTTGLKYSQSAKATN